LKLFTLLIKNNYMYKIYALIDPRTKTICYIGQTKNKLIMRLNQHNNPKSTNYSKIAKLSRFLKRNNLKFTIQLLTEHQTKEECNLTEINTISDYKNNGYKLKNIQGGGHITKNSKESIEKARQTYLKNKKLGLHKIQCGENAPLVKFNEKEILSIYVLIKKFYNNNEIKNKLNLPYNITTIQAIRSGQNWGHLWSLNFTKTIPSLFSLPNGISPRIKLKIIDLIVKGYTLEHIGSKFKRIKGDLKRVNDKSIWQKVWEVYNEYYCKIH